MSMNNDKYEVALNQFEDGLKGLLFKKEYSDTSVIKYFSIDRVVCVTIQNEKVWVDINANCKTEYGESDYIILEVLMNRISTFLRNIREGEEDYERNENRLAN